MTLAADRRVAAPSIDVLIESPLWTKQPAAEKTVVAAIAQAVAVLGKPSGEIAVLLTDDETIRALNRDWRGIDKATNVLSFPATAPGPQAGPPLLGDIAIAYETLARECADEGRAFLHHLSHLTVHGFLHLMGYDHQNDSEADAMERLESSILARLDVPDPYLARDTGNA